MIVIKTYFQKIYFQLFFKNTTKFFMRNQEKETLTTVVNVGYCESTSEWLNRIMIELADESKNFVDLSVICA